MIELYRINTPRARDNGRKGDLDLMGLIFSTQSLYIMWSLMTQAQTNSNESTPVRAYSDTLWLLRLSLVARFPVVQVEVVLQSTRKLERSVLEVQQQHIFKKFTTSLFVNTVYFCHEREEIIVVVSFLLSLSDL
ncbi:hypothetical protein NPIL_134011 [Nephila pilipes]|uniref:Uncharacterized protein n=1 Tax=Nephila pilipes TaxID=299642 RepID=A0A8X6TM65_NEPPI|nr:hypothetical protein NPIL_134011 [Nephila pilipes]